MIRYNTKRLWGYSGDTKPMTSQIGDRFLELDSRCEYLFTEYNEWVPIDCGGTGGCITHTDITWEELNAGNTAGTLQDCFYNVIDRPNSGTDPLYVLVEGGRVDLDNEVVRQEPSNGALCIENQKGFGCFNVYVETTTLSVSYQEETTVVALTIPCDYFIYYPTGTTVTQISPILGATGTVVFTYSTEGNCILYIQVTSGVFTVEGNITNGSNLTDYVIRYLCPPFSSLSVGTQVFGIVSSGIQPQGIITSISGGNIVITPTSGNWDGVFIFGANFGEKAEICFYLLTEPITIISEQLNSETVCWDAESYLGFGVYLNTLRQASDGLIYGTLQSDFSRDIRPRFATGQLFSLDPVTNLTKALFSFDGENSGSNPSCDVVEVAGELYGTCAGGGAYNCGTIWKWNIATSTFTKLYDFIQNIVENQDGNYPYGGLVNVGGVLYGTCQNGGDFGDGQMFKYDTTTDTYTALISFKNVPLLPANPQGTLVEVNPGELWGTSYGGGVDNGGTIFKYTISTGLLDVIINLIDIPNTGKVGASGGVHLGSDGNVYFNSIAGGADDAGTICQITNVSTTPTLNILYEFNGTTEFGYMDAVCPIYIGGNLYGVTNEYVGAIPLPVPPMGAIYKYNISSGILSILHNFTSTDGTTPYLGQLFQLGDELYGMTNVYGACVEFPCTYDTYGNIFKYNITADTYTNIHELNTQSQTSSDIAAGICASITNPEYSCTTVGNCIYVSGPSTIQGATLVLKTVVTYYYCFENCEPTTGTTIYDNSGPTILGTILTVTPDPLHEGCGTMTVELADNNYNPDAPFYYTVDETGCQGVISEVQGTSINYTVEPFTGGFSTVNLPCYYNVPYDVITEYPLSQKLTKSQIDYLVNNSLLVPGTYYRIMDVDLFLYGGTEIVIQAVSPNTFADTAMGKFYNPRYDQETPGYGVWDVQTEGAGGYTAGDTVIWGGLVWTYLDAAPAPIVPPSQYNLDYVNWSIPGRIKINISSISGTFNIGDYVYGYDNTYSGIVTYVDTDYIIVMAPPSFFSYPVYDTSNTIYDDDSGAQATMDSFEVTSDFYSDLIYNVVWDEIKYDYANDFISYRKDNSGNSVNQERWEYDDYGATGYRGILGMQWGNDFDEINYVGLGSNTFFGTGYAELINWKGGYCVGNNFYSSSVIFSYVAPSFNITFTNNSLNTSGFYGITLIDNSTIDFNTLSNATNVTNLTMDSTTNFSFNTLTNATNLDFGPTGTLPSAIRWLNANIVSVTSDLSTATIIYGNYSKTLISRQDGQPRIMYVDNSDVQQIVLVTA